MSLQRNPPLPPNAPKTFGGRWQDLLTGGRTAWSSSVQVQGKMYAARYWYDGLWINNAREDAAEVALMIQDPDNYPACARTDHQGQLYPQQEATGEES